MRNLWYLVSWISFLFSLPFTSSLVQSPLRVSIFRGGNSDSRQDYGNGITRGIGGDRPPATVRSDGNDKNENTYKILVSIFTKFGSKYLNKNMKFHVLSNTTVVMIKKLISSQYPGNPPISLQNLYFGFNKLNDSQKLSEITTLKVLPLQLDFLSGTNTYQNNPNNIQEAIQAYISLQIQQIFINKEISSLLSSSSSTNQETLTNSSLPQGLLYIEMFQILNQSFYTLYGDMIENAINAEREPPSLPSSVLNYKGATTESLGYANIDDFLDSKTYIQRWFTTQISLNKQILRSLLLYSLVWIAHGLYETEIPTVGRIAFFSFVPIIWLLQLRIIRYPLRFFKIFFFSLIARIPFILQLFPAQYQILAHSISLQSQKNLQFIPKKSFVTRIWCGFSEWMQLRILQLILRRAQKSFPLPPPPSSSQSNQNLDNDLEEFIDLLDEKENGNQE